MLREEIDQTKAEVKTDSLSLSISEISSMYDVSELNIIPEFQRLFRWSYSKKSNFIESILIGIPVPPIFAYEKPDGTWELIDGLQRVSTILEFMGLLRDVDTGERKPPIELLAAKYLPSLDGAVWEPHASHSENAHEIEKPLQLFFRRARLDVQVLKQPSDERTKFELFQRLNRGGAYANEQEVRSCSMVMANDGYMRSLRVFAQGSDKFKKLFRITQNDQEKQADIEYIVRILVHTFKNHDGKTEVQQFLDRMIIELFEERNAEEMVDVLTWLVDHLHAAGGDNALIPPKDHPSGAANRFSLRALEAIAVGVSRNRNGIEALENPIDFTAQKIGIFWDQEEVPQMSAGGLTGTLRLKRTVPFGENWFKPEM